MSKKVSAEKFKRIYLEEDQDFPRFEKFKDRKKNPREPRVKN